LKSGKTSASVTPSSAAFSKARGLNEHTNGLIRQYLSKGTSFEGLSQRQLDRVGEKIKAIAHRPRKDARIPDT
jgi:IS30 family transposase